MPQSRRSTGERLPSSVLPRWAAGSLVQPVGLTTGRILGLFGRSSYGNTSLLRRSWRIDGSRKRGLQRSALREPLVFRRTGGKSPVDGDRIKRFCRPGPQRPKLRRSPTLRKIDRISSEDISRSVHAVILAGGPSDNPLARYRAMPAVELGEYILLTPRPVEQT